MHSVFLNKLNGNVIIKNKQSLNLGDYDLFKSRSKEEAIKNAIKILQLINGIEIT